MKKIYAFISIIILTSTLHCGENKMKKRLQPEKIKLFHDIVSISGIAKEDTLAGLNYRGEFVEIKFDEKKIQIKTVLSKFPHEDCVEIKSDNESNIVWSLRGRGLYVLDLVTKQKGHCVVSSDGDDKVVNSQLIDPEKKIIMVEFSRLGPGIAGGIAGFIYILYDLVNDKIIYESPLYSGDFYRLKDDFLFFGKLKSEKGKLLFWNIRNQILEVRSDNNLIKKLNKLLIEVWSKSKPISLISRTMLGTGKVNGETVYYSIRWDEKFEDVKVEPIILQRPDGNDMDVAFEFSGDGKWVKTFRYPYSNGREMIPELMFYHVSDIYPQGLSMPILAGMSFESTQGAFLNHSKWGTCYAQLIGSHTLHVYKLNDGLKLLAEQAKSAVSP